MMIDSYFLVSLVLVVFFLLLLLRQGTSISVIKRDMADSCFTDGL